MFVIAVNWPDVAQAEKQQDDAQNTSQTSIDDLEPVGGVVTFTDGLKATAYVRTDVSSPAEDGTPIALTLSVEDSMRLRYQRVHFFPLPYQRGGNRWVAVKRMTVHPAGDFQVRTTFADAISCPGMIDMLAMAEQLDMPVIDLPDVPSGTVSIRTRINRYAPETVAHGLDYEMSAPSLFYETDTRARTLIGGSDNTPLGAWARATMAALEPCWSENMAIDLVEK